MVAEMTDLGSDNVDPFTAKAKESQTKLAEVLTNFQSLRANSDLFSSDTTLIYLVLKANIILSDRQIKAALGLGGINKVYSTIYAAIHHEVKFAAQQLFARGGFISLLEMPLTDLKQLCYEIALNYKSIFFVPIEAKLKVAGGQTDAFPLLTSYSSTDAYRGTYRNTYRSGHILGPYAALPHHISSTEHVSLRSDRTEFIEIVQFISKFNQMWIVAAFINREYHEIKKRSISLNTSY